MLVGSGNREGGGGCRTGEGGVRLLVRGLFLSLSPWRWKTLWLANAVAFLEIYQKKCNGRNCGLCVVWICSATFEERDFSETIDR